MKPNHAAFAISCLFFVAGPLSESRAEEKPARSAPVPEKVASAGETKTEKKAVEEAITKLSAALVAKDEKAALTLMTVIREAPEGYQQERLKYLLRWAESGGPVKIRESRELKEVAIVIIEENRKAGYGAMFFRMDAGQWKYVDDDVFSSRNPLSSVTDSSRKEFEELMTWGKGRIKELRAAARETP